MKQFEIEILKSLIKEESLKTILRDGFGYHLNKDVIEKNEELVEYSKYGLLVEISTAVSNSNIYDIVVYKNILEEGIVVTNCEYSVFTFKVSKNEMVGL